MPEQHFGASYAGNPPANYERYFVPAIGAPLAADLISLARLKDGERVLDVACGTGVVARYAVQQVGDAGKVVGLDVNPGMLAVARMVAPASKALDWQEASADSIPLPSDSFDVVLCQMGLQFMLDKQAALREMRRVLVAGGRFLLNVPGPTPRMMAMFEEGLARHVGVETAGFVEQVFSLHDTDEIRRLIEDAGFEQVEIKAASKSLQLPPPKEFFWQYVNSTPLAGAVAQADDEQLQLLERDVVKAWSEFVEDGKFAMDVRMVVVTARK